MIISIANQKGGVGKTTTAINIASAFSFIGKSTLLVDMDPQAHSSVSCTSNLMSLEKSLYDVLTDSNETIDDVIHKSTIPGLDIAVSRISMAKLESALVGEIDGHFKLKDSLEQIKNKYDVIVIDTPPTLGLITLNAFVTASHILIPIQPSYLCLEGTDDLLETIDKVKRVANPKLKIIGILITLYDRRTNISKDGEARIKKVFGSKVLKTIISKSVKLEESPAYKESIFTYAPNSIGAIQYRKAAEEILRRAKN